MEWVVKLEAKSGCGEMETIEVGRLERRVVGLTAGEVGLTLAEGKNLLGELARLISYPDGGIHHPRSCVQGLPEASTLA